MPTHRVFVRNWYRWERDRLGAKRLVPDPRARKKTLARGLSEDEARCLCKRYNAENKPGPLSRKAEFREE